MNMKTGLCLTVPIYSAGALALPQAKALASILPNSTAPPIAIANLLLAVKEGSELQIYSLLTVISAPADVPQPSSQEAPFMVPITIPVLPALATLGVPALCSLSAPSTTLPRPELRVSSVALTKPSSVPPTLGVPSNALARP
ncbi:hypothetical protein PMIN06_011778 [Paraphaeosphaeria minitans]